MFRFTIRDVLWLTVGLGAVPWVEHRNALRREAAIVEREKLTVEREARLAKREATLLVYQMVRSALQAWQRTSAAPGQQNRSLRK
jgi:hypothetical protein